jgi:hypothetical protein
MEKDTFETGLSLISIERSGPNYSYVIDYCEYMPTPVELAQYIIIISNAGDGELIIGVKNGMVYGVPVLESLEDWKNMVRKTVQDAADLLFPKYIDTIGINFAHISGTPRTESPRSEGSPRNKSPRIKITSSPRDMKKIARYTIHLTITGSKTKYSLIPGITIPDTVRKDLIRENDDLRSRLRAAESKAVLLEDSLLKLNEEKTINTEVDHKCLLL